MRFQEVSEVHLALLNWECYRAEFISLKCEFACIVAGGLTEVWPRITVSHHIYAALLWIAAALVWAWWLFPRLQESDEP